jgi:hypothetical protein
MIRTMTRVAGLVLLAGVLTAASADASTRIFVRIGPPPVPVYAPAVVPVAPAPYYGYVWRPGYYAWTGVGYAWVPGAWVLPPYAGAVWVPGRWTREPRGSFWVSGYWGRR